MNTYIIKKTSGNINWESIRELSMNNVYRKEVPEIKAFAKLCYDEEAIHIKLRAVEKNIRAEEEIPYGMSCNDSCLEFFFCPNENDSRYFNIEFTPNKCMFLGFGSGIPDLLRIVPDYTDNLFNAETKYNDDGWEIEYAVPYLFIKRFFPDFKVYSGKNMKANCYKCGDLTVQNHYLSWNKITLPDDKPDFTFHYPDDFGMMIFE